MRTLTSAVILAVGLIIFDGKAEGAGLTCFVGKGNSSLTLPATIEDQKAYQESQGRRTTFRILECGTSGSELKSIEVLAKNVSDQIQSKAKDLLNKIKGDEKRRKRQVSGGNWACVKVVLGGTAHRSCVPKFTEIKLSCNSGEANLALCYCHENNCNGVEGLFKGINWFIMMLSFSSIIFFI